MSFSLSTFRNAVALGSRPNNFSITFANPTGNGLAAPTINPIPGQVVSTTWNLLCKSAAVPAMSIGVVEIPVQGGRRVKIPGDRTFAEWTATFIADQNHLVRKYFEAWVSTIHTSNFEAVSRTESPTTGTTITGYKSDITIQQLNPNGATVTNGKYVLIDAYPSDVSAIDLSYDTTDSIEEFTVTFQYSYFTN